MKLPAMIYNFLLHLNQKARNLGDKVVGNYYVAYRDIVVITGGNGGLGTELCKIFTSKGSKVVSLDIKVPEAEDQVPGVYYFQCDVSVKEQVWAAQNKIKELIGTPSILINNAGIACGKSVQELSYEEIEKHIQVNLLSSFFTTKTFLPDMLEMQRGYIITIGSTLGYMSPAKLSTYGASKSGLIAFHESLTYELGSPIYTTGVKTLLLCPGQMNTTMFSSIQTPSKLFAPEIDAKYVARALVEAISLGKRGEIKMPFYGNIIPIVRAFPWPIVELIRSVSGIDRSMKAFKNGFSTAASLILLASASQPASVGSQSAISDPESTAGHTEETY